MKKERRKKTLKRYLYLFFDLFLRKEIHLKSSKKINGIATYDGSNQCVHPDVVEYNGKLFLALTPYPYGLDRYENPSLYCYKDGKWESFGKNPLVKVDNSIYHQSDPCLFYDEHDDSLKMIYRVTKRTDSKSSKLFCIRIGEKKPTLLLNENGKDYISPALLFTDKYHLFFVDCDKNNNLSVISNSKLSCLNSQESENVELLGFEDKQLWHIGISSSENHNSKSSSGNFDAICTLVDKNKKYSLSLAKLSYLNNKWLLKKTRDLPETFIDKYFSVYKSSLARINDKEMLFVSIQDNRQRWYVEQFELNKLLNFAV